MAEGKRVAKKKISEKATTILIETSNGVKDSSKTLAHVTEIRDRKGEKAMAEDRIENQAAKWTEMLMGMMNNAPAFATSGKALEPFMELTKMQQQHSMNISRTWIDQMWKIGEASRSGDVKKVLETCVESNKAILNTCQEAAKEEAGAQYKLLRRFIPGLPDFPVARS
jgi:hypothetical protein